MRSLRVSLFFSLIALLIVAGCATKPKAPPSVPDPESSSVQAGSAGLAPAGDAQYQSINFAILFGSRDAVASWSFSIVDQTKKNAVKTVKGDATSLPDKLGWDGKTDSGVLAAEGSYVAALSVDYAGKFNPGSASSKPFILDITAPSPSFTPNPAQYAYPSGGAVAPISVTLAAKPGLAKVASWGLDISDSAGNGVKSLKGTWPAGDVAWDGKTDSGAYVEMGKAIRFTLVVADEFGNKGTFKEASRSPIFPGPSRVPSPRKAKASPRRPRSSRTRSTSRSP